MTGMLSVLPSARAANRWQAIKKEHPGAELDRETTASHTRMIRGRLAPDQPWTPWAMGLNKVISTLEQIVKTEAGQVSTG